MKQEFSIGEHIRSILANVVFMLLLLITTPVIFLISLFSLGKANNWIVKHAAPILGKPVLWCLDIEFEKIDHREKVRHGVIYIFNHSSTLDIPAFLSLGLERMRVVAKWELQYIPFLFVIGRMTGQVFIKRSKREHAIKALKKTYSRLKKHDLNLVIAPEGTRKHSGIIGPFKKGAFRMAIDLGYPIVPIYFDGTRRLSPGGSMLSHSGKITAHIYPEIDTTGWSEETLEAHIREVRSLYLNWADVSQEKDTIIQKK